MENLIKEYKHKITIAHQHRDSIKEESNPNWIKFNTIMICYSEVFLDLGRAIARDTKKETESCDIHFVINLLKKKIWRKLR